MDYVRVKANSQKSALCDVASCEARLCVRSKPLMGCLVMFVIVPSQGDESVYIQKIPASPLGKRVSDIFSRNLTPRMPDQNTALAVQLGSRQGTFRDYAGCGSIITDSNMTRQEFGQTG